MIGCADMATAVLTGFMGTGKSSVGVRLAARLGIPFVDTDEMIERREGCTIAELFARKGEGYFRDAERRAVVEASAHEDAVIATGGGAIVDAENLERLRAAAPVICLTATPDVILERTGKGASSSCWRSVRPPTRTST
jgi:shikimate kinase